MDVYNQVKHRLQAPTLACVADGRVDGHAITKFLGWMDYQSFLVMGLW